MPDSELSAPGNEFLDFLQIEAERDLQNLG